MAATKKKITETKATKTATKRTTAKKIVDSKKTKESAQKTKEQTEKKERVKPAQKTYNVFFEGKDMGTHPQGKQPKQAARKAITPIFMSLVDAKKNKNKIAEIEKLNNPKKKDKNNNVIKTHEYKKAMKEYEKDLSKDLMDKYYLFYLIQKSPRIRREYRHYYYGMRQSINPDVNSYLTKVDPNLPEEELNSIKKENRKIMQENKNLPKDKQKKLKEIPKILIDEKDFNGELIKDENGNVIKVKIPHYETRLVLDEKGNVIMEPAKKKNGELKIDKNGKVIMKKKKERVPNKPPRIITYKYNNIVSKLTKEFYDLHKAEFNLSEKEEKELMDHFNHVRPPKIETKKEQREREKKEQKKQEKKEKEEAKKKEREEKKNKAAKPADKKITKKTAEKKPATKKAAPKKPTTRKAAAKK